MAVFKAGAPEMGGGFVILPKGDYPFEVVDAKWKRAQSGSDMIELKMRVSHGEQEANVWDFLVFGEKSIWKLDQFLKSVGLHPGEGAEYDVDDFGEGTELKINGDLVPIESLIAQKGNVSLKVGKNNKGEDRNEVVGFIWGGEF